MVELILDQITVMFTGVIGLLGESITLILVLLFSIVYSIELVNCHKKRDPFGSLIHLELLLFSHHRLNNVSLLGAPRTPYPNRISYPWQFV